MVADLPPAPRRVRTLFLSDVHLGCRYAQLRNLVDYLDRVRPDQLYLVGDFLDGWKLKAGWRWDPAATAIVRRLLWLAQHGTEIYYTPGNHDNFLRIPEVQRLVEQSGVRVRIQDEFVFATQDGTRFLVTHGDKFDVVEMRCQWLSTAASFIYDPLLAVNWGLSRLRRGSDQKRRSPYAFSAFAKDRVKRLVRFLSNFEQKLYAHAQLRDCDGVICGHIHRPVVERSGAVTYVNTGDWVENCTALVERYDGTLWLESYYQESPPQLAHAPDANWQAEQEALIGGSAAEDRNAFAPASVDVA
jgi:UDP-2,3-diacylglucosamine pyrophosphatase LpxH